MQLTVERVQADAVAGLKTVDADQLVRLSSELRRLLGALHAGAEQNRPPPGAALAAYPAGRDDE
jgi:hypothetical protein